MEWKIDGWFMKTLFVLAAISGLLDVIAFVVGFIGGAYAGY